MRPLPLVRPNLMSSCHTQPFLIAALNIYCQGPRSIFIGQSSKNSSTVIYINVPHKQKMKLKMKLKQKLSRYGGINTVQNIFSKSHFKPFCKPKSFLVGSHFHWILWP